MNKYIVLLLLLSLVTYSPPELNMYVCPDSDCEQIFYDIFKTADTISCAFYDIDEVYYNYLTSLNASLDIILEKDNRFSAYNHSFDKNPYYMHNKFCIIDNHIVLTGSTNPTVNGLTRNNNTLIIIDSKDVAKSYYSKFNSLKGNMSSHKSNFDTLNLYFCPEDNCRDKVIAQIRKTKSSIHFETFSFTDKAIATELILAKDRGIHISGIIETRMATNSVYALLRTQGINVVKDNHRATMHHKLFIFDNTTILTGSYNPTNNGNKRNDENLILFVKNS